MARRPGATGPAGAGTGRRPGDRRGELLVIKNRRTVLRKSYGWQDRDAGKPMHDDAMYCIRSMTKPLVGTAIQMLIDDGRLRLDTPVHDVLPSFDRPRMDRITVEHLLTHTAGFPMTTMRKPLVAYANLGDIASEAAQTELLSDPGPRFRYSDASADILGAMVAAITHVPLEQYIQQRILDPLAMRDTYTLLGDNAAVKQRIPVAYSGGTGAWEKHWEPSDPPIFPLFLGSQGLYSTTTDYAKFLALWMDGGKLDGHTLFSPAAITRALQPRHSLDGNGDKTMGLAITTDSCGRSARRRTAMATRNASCSVRRLGWHPCLGVAGPGPDGAVSSPNRAARCRASGSRRPWRNCCWTTVQTLRPAHPPTRPPPTRKRWPACTGTKPPHRPITSSRRVATT